MTKENSRKQLYKGSSPPAKRSWRALPHFGEVIDTVSGNGIMITLSPRYGERMAWNSPKGIASHPGVDRIVSGGNEGSDRKYWVFLKEGWGFYEHGQRDDHYWICGGFGVDSVAEFRGSSVEYRADRVQHDQCRNG